MNQLHLPSSYSLIVDDLLPKDENAVREKLPTLELRVGQSAPSGRTCDPVQGHEMRVWSPKNFFFTGHGEADPLLPEWSLEVMSKGM